MANHARLSSLQARKQELEHQLHQETTCPAQNTGRIFELKRRKLIIKDQISQLKKAN